MSLSLKGSCVTLAPDNGNDSPQSVMDEEKNHFKKRMEDLGKNNSAPRQELPDDIKCCPFQSSPDCEVPCTSRCALWRPGKNRGYECPISELTGMSWIMKGSPAKGQNNGGQVRRYN